MNPLSPALKGQDVHYRVSNSCAETKATPISIFTTLFQQDTENQPKETGSGAVLNRRCHRSVPSHFCDNGRG